MEKAARSPVVLRSPRIAFVPRIPLRRARSLVALWYDRHLQRHDLALLDERALADLGLTPGDVRAEIAKPFWR